MCRGIDVSKVSENGKGLVLSNFIRDFCALFLLMPERRFAVRHPNLQSLPSKIISIVTIFFAIMSITDWQTKKPSHNAHNERSERENLCTVSVILRLRIRLRLRLRLCLESLWKFHKNVRRNFRRTFRRTKKKPHKPRLSPRLRGFF